RDIDVLGKGLPQNLSEANTARGLPGRRMLESVRHSFELMRSLCADVVCHLRGSYLERSNQAAQPVGIELALFPSLLGKASELFDDFFWFQHGEAPSLHLAHADVLENTLEFFRLFGAQVLFDFLVVDTIRGERHGLQRLV